MGSYEECWIIFIALIIFVVYSLFKQSAIDSEMEDIRKRNYEYTEKLCKKINEGTNEKKNHNN